MHSSEQTPLLNPPEKEDRIPPRLESAGLPAVAFGEAALYQQTRPSPPVVLLDILTQLIHTPQPALVVDLGCGTGLSTAIWGGRAQRVIGIEPNADMRNQAIRTLEQHPSAEHIEYREGVSHQTELPAGSTDIVTCSQSFHWMEPTSTLAEVARILRPGGIFAVYDYSWPPTINWELERAYQEMETRFDALQEERGFAQNLPRWSKDRHLDRMRASGHFRFTKELRVHHIEQGDATRLLGLIMTNGYSHHLKLGAITEQEIGLDRFKHATLQQLGPEPIPWYFSYQVRIGVK